MRSTLYAAKTQERTRAESMEVLARRRRRRRINLAWPDWYILRRCALNQGGRKSWMSRGGWYLLLCVNEGPILMQGHFVGLLETCTWIVNSVSIPATWLTYGPNKFWNPSWAVHYMFQQLWQTDTVNRPHRPCIPWMRVSRQHSRWTLLGKCIGLTSDNCLVVASSVPDKATK